MIELTLEEHDRARKYTRVTAYVRNSGTTEQTINLVHWGGIGTMAVLPSVKINGEPLPRGEDQTWFVSSCGARLPVLRPGELIAVDIRLTFDSESYDDTQPRTAVAYVVDPTTDAEIAKAELPLHGFGINTKVAVKTCASV